MQTVFLLINRDKLKQSIIMRWLRTSRSEVKDILGKKSIQLIILDQGVLKLLQHFKNKGQLLLHDTHIRQNWKSTLGSCNLLGQSSRTGWHTGRHSGASFHVPGPWSIHRSSSPAGCASLVVCAFHLRSGPGSWWRTWGGEFAALAARNSRIPEIEMSPSEDQTELHTWMKR